MNVIGDDDRAKAKDDIRVEAARIVANVIREGEKKKTRLLFPHNFFQPYFPVSASVSPLIYSDTRESLSSRYFVTAYLSRNIFTPSSYVFMTTIRSIELSSRRKAREGEPDGRVLGEGEGQTS